jgi:PAS domain S-box-containing protein
VEAEKSQLTSQKRRPPLVLAILTLSLATTFSALVVLYVQNLSNNVVRQSFDKETTQISLVVEGQIKATLHVLASFKGLYSGSEIVERGEFAAVAEVLQKEIMIPGLTGLFFAEHVTQDERSSFEERVRTGPTEDTIDLSSYAIQNTEQSEYLPIVFVEPQAELAMQLGSDLFSSPIIKAAAERARDSGTTITTPPVPFPAPLQHTGLYALTPIYSRTDVSTLEEYRETFVGVVGALVSSDELFDQILGNAAFSQAIDIELYDSELQGAEIYDSRPQLDDGDNQSSLHAYITQPVAGRTWVVHAHALSNYGQQIIGKRILALVMAIGILLSLFSFFGIFSYASSQIRAVRYAEKVTQDLKRQGERLEQSKHTLQELLEAAPDPVVVLDRLGRVTQVNRATEQASGYTRKELVGRFIPNTGVIAPSSLPTVLKQFAFTISGRVHPPYEVQVKTKAGETRFFEINARPIKQNNKVVGVQATFRDVTERKKTKDLIQTQRDELEQVNRFMVGREVRMKELKEEIERLRKRMRP